MTGQAELMPINWVKDKIPRFFGFVNGVFQQLSA
jgi:hypothetical protein